MRSGLNNVPNSNLCGIDVSFGKLKYQLALVHGAPIVEFPDRQVGIYISRAPCLGVPIRSRWTFESQYVGVIHGLHELHRLPHAEEAHCILVSHDRCWSLTICIITHDWPSPISRNVQLLHSSGPNLKTLQNPWTKSFIEVNWNYLIGFQTFDWYA